MTWNAVRGHELERRSSAGDIGLVQMEVVPGYEDARSTSTKRQFYTSFTSFTSALCTFDGKTCSGVYCITL